MKGTQHSTLADIPCDCDNDPIGCLRHMFVDVVQRGRIEKGQCPAKRPVFLRLHGVAAGRLEVVPGLPEAYRVGIFSGPASYPAWVRFSSDIPDGYPDLKTTVGLGVKLFDVAGEKMLPLDKHAPTADFVFQNHDVFFVKNARDMCSFTKASMTGKEEYDKWIEENPETDIVLKAMEKRVPSALTESFWSVIPFRFGMGRYCKYKIEPELDSVWPEPNYEDPTYLKTDMERRLSSGEVRYRFLIQMRLNPESMPLDNAMARWDEKLSPPQHVATLILPKQDITARGQAAYGEELAFNPWRTLKEHEPVESLAEARKVIYQASAELRHNVNGQPRGEPEIPRPETVWPAGKDSVIVRAAIHPGIGIARVGNSKASDGFYIGPEVIEPMPAKASDMRDSNGALKRQAARFRVYGYNAAGEVVGELTSDTATITWQVHLANRKAQWYQFQNALDIPEAAEDAFPLRNADIKGAARSGLAIDPGARSIAGKETSGVEYQFNTGEFQGTVVDLGELRTDPVGRLLVLGGYGVSASPAGKPIYDPAKPGSFNNANGWYDDTSDGPVTATVSIAGRDVPVDSAWVVVAPPNFAPDIVGWRTLYDQLTDVYVEGGGLPFPEMASFTRDVLPALSRLNNLQWVNKGFATMFGQGGQFNFSDPTLIAKLAHRPSSGEPDTYEELRRVVFNAFRPADTQVNEPRTWPLALW
ncbi:LodA/GoxA family CTQ-dependent oxidase [Pseudomonas purpurea]|uniref:LodA/GoxA family CTQ-dependent oxidase n=1 Tax=Pseudomonas purpurea TaxID=3136737 RepID=UPI003264907B